MEAVIRSSWCCNHIICQRCPEIIRETRRLYVLANEFRRWIKADRTKQNRTIVPTEYSSVMDSHTLSFGTKTTFKPMLVEKDVFQCVSAQTISYCLDSILSFVGWMLLLLIWQIDSVRLVQRSDTRRHCLRVGVWLCVCEKWSWFRRRTLHAWTKTFSIKMTHSDSWWVIYQT